MMNVTNSNSKTKYSVTGFSLRKNMKMVTACSVMALLSACGGDDSNSSSTTPSEDSVGGIASKGILNGATVTVSELVGTQWIDRGTTTTAPDGSYVSTLIDYTDGPVRVKVDSTSDTKMKCDAPSGCTAADGSAVAFGADVVIGTGLTLEAILPSKSADAHITPLTHLAAGRIENTTGTIDSESIRSVHLQVASSFGLPAILGVKPVDAGSDVSGFSSDEQQMALTVASIAEMMSSYDTNKNGTTSAVEFVKALEVLRDDFKDGNFSTVTDGTGTLESGESVFSAVFSAKEKLLSGTDTAHTHFRDTFKMPANELTRGAAATKVMTDKIAAAVMNNHKPITPAIPILDNITDVALAKNIVSDIRTLVTSLDSSRDYFSPFEEKIKIAETIASSKINEHLEWFGLAVGAIFENNIVAVRNKAITISGDTDIPALLTISDTNSGSKFDVTASASSTNPAINASYESNLSLADFNANDSPILSQLNLKLTGTMTEQDSSVTTNINSVSVNIVFNREMNLNVDNQSDFKEVTMSGNINAVVAAHGNGSEREPKAEVHGLFSTTVVANNNFSSISDSSNLNLKGLMFSGKMMSGTQSLNGKLELIASRYRTTLAAESASNFSGGILHLSLNSALTGYPNTDVLITLNRSQANTGEVIISVNQRDQRRSLVLNVGVTGLLASGAVANNTLTVTSNDRTKLVLTRSSDTGSFSGTVSVGDTTVATISDSFIRYEDGTFDSLSY